MSADALDKPPSSHLPDERAEPMLERLRAALYASGTGTWKWDVAADEVDWDEPLARVYGLAPDQAPRTAAEFATLVHPDDREHVAQTVASALADGSDLDFEFRIVQPNGSVRWVYDRSKVVRDAAGKPLYVIGASHDITSRKQAEGELAASKARLELAARAADLGIWDWDLRTDEIIYSERAKAIFGFGADEAVTLDRVRGATHPEDRARTSAMARRALDPMVQAHEPYEYRIVRPDGAVRWVVAHGQPVFQNVDGAPRAVRYAGTIQDITTRKEIQQALSASEARLRLAVDAGRLGVWEYDPARDRLTGSVELNRLLGFADHAQVTLDDIRAGFDEGERDRVRAASEEALARGERFIQVDFQYRRPDGERRWFLLRAELQLPPGGGQAPAPIVGVILDITDQKRATDREQLLTRELNHRFKNTFATIIALVSQTLRHAKDAPRAAADLEARLRSLARAHDILTADWSENVGLRDLVAAVLAPFDRGTGRLRFGGPDIRVRSRIGLDLAMALHELATNAVKHGAFTTDSGRVDLTWSMQPLQDAPGLRLIWRESGGPPVHPPKAAGFGTRLIAALPNASGGAASLDYEVTGLVCTLSFGLAR